VYAEIAPTASHALHMPSHTYTRVGSWQESIESNRASASSARAEGSVAEELHALDYMAYAHLQKGEDRAVREVMAALPEVGRRFDAGPGAGAAPPASGVYAIAAIPARYALERGAWSEAARLEARSTPVPYADAVSHFARAIGAARSGDAAVPRAAIGELERLKGALERAREAYWAEQVEIQRRGAAAWLAFAEGRRDEALAAMRAAADMEDATEKNAVTPGPIAPARELVGEMLMELNRPADALVQYERTLTKEPKRFRALLGAARAARAAGDAAKARRYATELLEVAAQADQPGRPELAEARRLAGS
jgi:tetratricopeptide (TPR) repeat protein